MGRRIKNSKGFTLVELIMVIVVLGILAAVAIPRFVDLQTRSRSSVAHGITGALVGQIMLLHSRSLVTNANPYDATTVVGSIDTSGVDSIDNDAAVITATVDGSTFSWTYTPRSGVIAARVAEGF